MWWLFIFSILYALLNIIRCKNNVLFILAEIQQCTMHYCLQSLSIPIVIYNAKGKQYWRLVHYDIVVPCAQVWHYCETIWTRHMHWDGTRTRATAHPHKHGWNSIPSKHTHTQACTHISQPSNKFLYQCWFGIFDHRLHSNNCHIVLPTMPPNFWMIWNWI